MVRKDVPTWKKKIVRIVNAMAEFLSIEQLKKLQEVIVQELSENEPQRENISNDEYITRFLNAKQMEGCSDRTIQYYRVTIEHFLKDISNPVRKISTEQIRDYLVRYQKINNCSKVTIDNVRRNISSFFSWLEEEDYILKSPMRRIHKIKTKTVVKETISDEAIEKLRDHCTELRDLYHHRPTLFYGHQGGRIGESGYFRFGFGATGVYRIWQRR